MVHPVLKYTSAALLTLTGLTACTTHKHGNELFNVPTEQSVHQVRANDTDYINRIAHINATNQNLNDAISQASQRPITNGGVTSANLTLENALQTADQYEELNTQLQGLTNLPNTIRAYTLQPGSNGTAITNQTEIDRGAILPHIGRAMEPLDNILSTLDPNANYRIYQFMARGTQLNENGLSAIMYIVPATEENSNLNVVDDLNLGFNLFHNQNTRNVRLYTGNHDASVHADWSEGRLVRDAALAGVSGIWWPPAIAINGGRLAIGEAIDRNGNVPNNYNGNTVNQVISGQQSLDVYDQINLLARRVMVENSTSTNQRRNESPLSELYVAQIRTSSEANAPDGLVIALGTNMDGMQGQSPISYLSNSDGEMMYNAIELERTLTGDFWPLNIIPIVTTDTRTINGGSNPPSGGGFGQSGPGLGGN